MQITIPTKFHAYHLENFRFDLQRFTDVTVTPTATDGLKDGSTITVTFEAPTFVDYQEINKVTFTYNATNNSFNETHSGPFTSAARAYIENDNIVIQLDDLLGNFSLNDEIDTITLDTANNKWTFSKGNNTYPTSNYSFSFNGTTISYDANNAFSSSFKDIIFGIYTITIGEQTYSVEFGGDGNLTKVNGTDLVDGKVTLGGKTYNFSGNTSSITYSEVVGNEWTVDNGLAKYGTDSETLITISGLKNPSAADGAISGLTLDETAKTVTVAKDLLGENDVTITSDDYTLQLGDGITTSTTIPAHFDNLTYKAATKTTGYALSDDKKQIVYTAGTTITPTATDGLKDGSTIAVTFQDQNGSNVTATFTYNATTNSFNETHSFSWFSCVY